MNQYDSLIKSYSKIMEQPEQVHRITHTNILNRKFDCKMIWFDLIRFDSKAIVQSAKEIFMPVIIIVKHSNHIQIIFNLLHFGMFNVSMFVGLWQCFACYLLIQANNIQFAKSVWVCVRVMYAPCFSFRNKIVGTFKFIDMILYSVCVVCIFLTINTVANWQIEVELKCDRHLKIHKRETNEWMNDFFFFSYIDHSFIYSLIDSLFDLLVCWFVNFSRLIRRAI